MSGKAERSLQLPCGQLLNIHSAADGLHCLLGGERVLSAAPCAGQPQRLQITLADTDALNLRRAVYGLLLHRPDIEELQFDEALQGAVDPALMFDQGNGRWLLYRTAFWQCPQLWLSKDEGTPVPSVMMVDANGRRHPRRAVRPSGEVYRRFDHELQAWVSLRVLDIDEDLLRFNRWQNSRRVASFWEETGSLEKHRVYLQALFDDPRVLPLIGCIDDEPFAYFEAYWAKEDRIAPFYQVGDFDRGIHMLVGEERHRGPHKVKAWLQALCHYLFLDDPRTTRIVSEPRYDNDKMVTYLQKHRFGKMKEFDFPHKRASLMVLRREAFFDRCDLG